MARGDADWLERKGLLCRTVTIKVRYSDFTTVTRSHSQVPATRDPDVLAARACALLDRTEAGRRPVRLLGVSVHNLTDPRVPPPDASLPFAGDLEAAARELQAAVGRDAGPEGAAAQLLAEIKKALK